MKVHRVEGWEAFETFIAQLKDFPYREMANEKDTSIGRLVHWRDLYNQRCDVVFLIELSGNGLDKWPLYESSVKNPNVVSAESGHLSKERHSVESMRSFKEALCNGTINVDDCGIASRLTELKKAVQRRFALVGESIDVPVFHIHYRAKQA